jgi:hypothetical protein
MVVAGLCPGTSCVAAASGADGLFVMLRYVHGVLVAGWVSSAPGVPGEQAARRAHAPALLGVPTACRAGVVALALVAFRFLDRFERPA